MLKSLFGAKKKSTQEEDRELTIEDLITLERWEEAHDQLRLKIKKTPKDLHAHLRMAEVHLGLTNVQKALDEYIFVADSLADDGFFDKGIALLAKASKLAPGDDTIPRRISKLERLKMLERRRRLAIEGLMENKTTGVANAANSQLELEMLWSKIARSHLVTQLSADQMKKMFSVMVMQRITESTVLATHGEELEQLILIVAGTVQARADLSGQEVEIRAFSTGDLIGEGALLEHRPWPATYVATSACTVFTLDRDGLQVAMQGDEDPRGFISVLRQQNNDRDVAANLHRLASS